MIAAAGRFDAIYGSLLAAGRSDWSDQATTTEILGYLDELLRHTGTTSGELLELGCGTGTLSFPLAERGYQVTGLDISATAIALARARARQFARQFDREITFGVHDIRAPLAALAGRFALVVDSLVLHYLTAPADRVAGLRLAASALRPDGAMLVITMCGDPRHIPPGSVFDPGTRLLMTAGVAECHYAEADALAGLFERSGLCPSYSHLISGSDATRAQDLYLAVLRTLN
jgi:SAM-dependent methyltransferase